MQLYALCFAIAFSGTGTPAEAFAEDAAFMRKALEDLHPGISRYRSRKQEAEDYRVLIRELEESPALPKAYAAISRYLAGIRCGHTFLNPYNQPDHVRVEVYGQRDKLPFLFRWIDQEMVVTQASEFSPVRRGDIIRSIQGISSGNLGRRLMGVARADGGRDNFRRHVMSLNGLPIEEADAFLPVFAPPSDGRFQVWVERESRSLKLNVLAVTAQERQRSIGLSAEADYDQAWSFERRSHGLHVLRLRHFITWHMKSDWKKFLRESFAEVKKEPNRVLLIDLRGCEGGSSEPMQIIASEILDRPLALRQFETRTVYRSVAPDLRPNLETWDSSAFDLTGRVEASQTGGFRLKPSPPQTVGPFANAFRGQVFVAIDSANSSGGFLAAWFLQDSQRVKLIGEETAGSRRGLNAGQMFFLRLPKSGIRVDIPIYATHPLDEQPERGIVPEIKVPVRIEHIREGRDPVLEEIHRRISSSRNR